jgi:DNA polymerase-1
MACVENAARRGEAGGVVTSVLGRTSPPPGEKWRAVVAGGSDDSAGAAGQRRAREYARSWGRFTRNFVVQASAADWASVWLSCLRRELQAVPGAELVFFQHDELVVHAPAGGAATVAELAVAAAEQARDLVFPGASASTPVRPLIVGSYAEAK